MAEEVRINEMVKITGLGQGAAGMLHNEAASRVWIWDCGPPKPLPPKRPEVPKGKEGDPEYDLALIEFAELKDAYAAALKAYARDKDEFAKWQKDNGGPYLIAQWSCDAQDTFANDARAVTEGRQAKRRYYMSSRTRGYSNLPNGGLPEGVKPGHKHAENMRREEAGDADMEYARRKDPVFGDQEIRS
jgi:hypothetical protein